MPYKDKKKAKEYSKRWNKAYYSKHKKEEIERSKARKKMLREWFNKYKKNLSCSKCGENHTACLEFHHLNEKEKSFGISHSIESMGYSKEKMMNEIKKCIVLCSNCHRKLHSN